MQYGACRITDHFFGLMYWLVACRGGDGRKANGKDGGRECMTENG